MPQEHQNMYTKRNEQTIMSRFTRDSKKQRGIVVEVRGDDFGRALRTWSKKVQDTGLLKEVKERMAYEKPAELKQRMKKQARKRWERTVEEMISNGAWHKDHNY
jgi:ribosomal protein S21